MVQPFFSQNRPDDPVRWNLGRFFMTQGEFTYIYIYIYIYICYGDISYHTPMMDSYNLNIFSKLARSAKTTSRSRLLWGGARPMVRRQVCIQRTRNGGLGMPDLESHWLAGLVLGGGRSVETKGESDFSSPPVRPKGWRST